MNHKSKKTKNKKPLIVEIKRQEENTELFVNKTTVASQASFLLFALCKVLMSAFQVHKSLNWRWDIFGEPYEAHHNVRNSLSKKQ